MTLRVTVQKYQNLGHDFCARIHGLEGADSAVMSRSRTRVDNTGRLRLCVWR